MLSFEANPVKIIYFLFRKMITHLCSWMKHLWIVAALLLFVLFQDISSQSDELPDPENPCTLQRRSVKIVDDDGCVASLVLRECSGLCPSIMFTKLVSGAFQTIQDGRCCSATVSEFRIRRVSFQCAENKTVLKKYHVPIASKCGCIDLKDLDSS